MNRIISLHGDAESVGKNWKKKQAARELRKLTALKKKSNSKKVEVAVENIKNKFGALNKFAKLCSKTNRVIYRLCDTKKKKIDESQNSRKLASGDREEIKQHAISEEAVNYLPTACYANIGFLKKPLKHNYEDFIQSRDNLKRPISFSSYYRNTPKNVKPMTKTPHLQCTCEKCDNIDKMSSKLIGNQFSGIDRNLKKAMESGAHLKMT